MSRALDLLTDACVGLPATVRKMFGGHGFFAPNGGMFAVIVTNDEIMLKLVLGPARDELISLGGHPWVYQGSGRSMTMAEWIVIPEGFYDDQEQLTAWAQRSLELVPAKGTRRPAKKRSKAPMAPPKTKAKAKPRKPPSRKRPAR
jgi:TfoX/Sxy family transcriptional regulator of competence genes